jgi:hypothetical protein
MPKPKKSMFSINISADEVTKGIRKPSAPKGKVFKSKKQYTRKNDSREWED